MFNRIKNVFFQVVGYTIILMIVSYLFKNTIYLDDSYYGMWCFLAALLIYVLNKTVKPFLVWLTIPITGITLGLFYPFINLGILKLVSLMLGGHFKIYGIWFAVLASILISILNVIFDDVVMKRVTGKKEH